MTPQEELQTLNNAILFLRRTNLSGEEVPAYTEVMQYLGARHQGLNAMLQSKGRKEAAEIEDVPEISPSPGGTG